MFEILNKYFGEGNVEEVKERIFFCVKKSVSGIPYQIIYIDCTDSWLQETYSRLFEEVVIEKYYNCDGYLQWNFYYYIISSPEQIKKFHVQKKKIEDDDTYTRKIVFTQEEFLDWLNLLDRISALSAESVSTELYGNWVNCLRENKLYFVFNSEKYPNYKQPADDYVNGLHFNEIEESLSSEDPFTVPRLRKISELELVEYREYPKSVEPIYRFGNVNLIFGSNAVGKTSLLDALELTITGRVFYKTINDSYILKVKSADGEVMTFPDKPAVYKARDISWYGTGANRRNELNDHFNKFNYYSADAAFQLKQEDSEGGNNLDEVIADIALGREINKLEERIQAFTAKFSEHEKYYLKEVTRLNKSLREKNQLITELTKQQKFPASYKDHFMSIAKESNWKPTFEDDVDGIARLDGQIRLASELLSKIQGRESELNGLITIQIVDHDLYQLNKKKLAIANLKGKIFKCREDSQVCSKDLLNYNSMLMVIKELEKYYDHPRFQDFLGLEDKILGLSMELKKVEEVKQLANSVFSNDVITNDDLKTIRMIEENLNSQYGILITSNRQINSRIKEIESGLEELSMVISKLKQLGADYLRLNPGAENCPLCNTFFDTDELIRAIEKTKEGFTISSDLAVLRQEFMSVERELVELGRDQEALDGLKRLAYILFPEDGIDKSINDIKVACSNNSSAVSTLTESLLQLNALQSDFHSFQLFESNFLTLSKSLEGQLSIQIKSGEDLLNQKIKIENEIENLHNSRLQLDKTADLAEIEMKEHFDVDIFNEEILKQRIVILNDVNDSFKQLQLYFGIEQITPISELAKKLASVKSAFEAYKNEVTAAAQQNHIIDITSKEVKMLLNEIDEVKPKYFRAKNAAECLKKLMADHNKKEYLEDYIKNNKTEIVSIFKIIHSPKEFEDISFEDGKIVLLSKDGKMRNLTEISTGQRSALALSIFLSLNKKLVKGPDILMFDDPVAYIDDMNMLSFLDYLRELVVRTNRQIFFVTANEDLSFLFRKKFEFLGDEGLKIVPLEREAYFQ